MGGLHAGMIGSLAGGVDKLPVLPSDADAFMSN